MEYLEAIEALARGEITTEVEDPVLAQEIGDIRDWCARISLRKTPQELIHDLHGPEVEAWLLISQN